jgi:hypothetical protein
MSGDAELPAGLGAEYGDDPGDNSNLRQFVEEVFHDLQGKRVHGGKFQYDSKVISKLLRDHNKVPTFKDPSAQYPALSHIRALERLFARLRIPGDNHEDRIDLLISSLQDPAALRFEKEMGRQPGMCSTWLGIKAMFMSVFARPEDKEELEERLDRLERKKGHSVRDLCTEVLQL